MSQAAVTLAVLVLAISPGKLVSWGKLGGWSPSAPRVAHSGASPPPPSLPYRVWLGEALPSPGPPSPEVRPPAVGRAQHARRPLEVAGGVGACLPLEASETPREEADTTPLPLGSLAVLWRVHPHFAWGPVLDRAEREPLTFRRRRGEPTARNRFVGVGARVYARDQGVFDPYLQLDLGHETSRLSRTVSAGGRIVRTTAGPAVRVGAGVDWWLAPHWRVGFAGFLTQERAKRRSWCAGPCSGFELNDRDRTATSVAFSARQTIMLGSPH